MRHVAIAMSYKFEELNLLLEILKLNFKNPPHVTVFCNLNKADYERHRSVINHSLIDDFHHVPDDRCNITNTDRDTKRRQPLEMFYALTGWMGGLGKDFAFVEGDTFPLDEEAFFKQLSCIQDNDFLTDRWFFEDINPDAYDNTWYREKLRDSQQQVHKMPMGYVCPSPSYIGRGAALQMHEYIKGHWNELLDGKKNFEGCLGVMCEKTGIFQRHISRYMCWTYPYTNQVNPTHLTIHQHNIMNLRDTLAQHSITKGDTIRLVMTQNSYRRAIDGTLVTRDDSIKMEPSTLFIPKDYRSK